MTLAQTPAVKLEDIETNVYQAWLEIISADDCHLFTFTPDIKHYENTLGLPFCLRDGRRIVISLSEFQDERGSGLSFEVPNLEPDQSLICGDNFEYLEEILKEYGAQIVSAPLNGKSLILQIVNVTKKNAAEVMNAVLEAFETGLFRSLKTKNLYAPALAIG